jgi:cytochrome c553
MPMARWQRLVRNPNLVSQALFALALAVVPACGDDSSDDDGAAGRGGSGRGGSGGRGGSSGGAGTGGLAGSGGGTAGTGGGTAGTGGGTAGTGGGTAGTGGGKAGGGGTSGTGGKAGGGGTSGTGGKAGSGGAGGSAGSPGNVSEGQKIAANMCASCHTQDLTGMTTPITGSVYPRNLTPHATGIAGWTDEEITRAVREGRDREGDTLCFMTRFDTTAIRDDEMRDLIAYLRSLTPVDRAIPSSSCD